MINISKKNCSGCKACADVCPLDLITFLEDKEGFWYPSINREMCVDCGLCDKVCPSTNNDNTMNLVQPDVYSIWSKNKEVRLNSTSGGAFYEFAIHFMNDGGYIAGCVYDADNKSAKHIVTNDKKMLPEIMRSKYFQSDTKGIYSSVRDLLKCGERVLFCGTPCQVRALKNYIGGDDDNLFLIDFVCRGINSPKAYRSFLSELESKYKSAVLHVRFKDKSKGWMNLGTKVLFQNGSIYYKTKYNDPWVNGFVNGNLFIRPFCTECPHKGFPRIADITLGDFWGLDESKHELYQGISLLMVNNRKGKLMLERIRDDIHIKRESLEVAIKGNPCIMTSAPYDDRRHRFFDLLNNGVYFSKAVWTAMDSNCFKRIKEYVRVKINIWRL